MKYLVTLTLIATLLGNSTSQDQPDCKRYQTGVFLNKPAATGEINTRVTRTEQYQIEEYFPLQLWGRFKIEWINDCKYKLTLDSANEAGLKVMNINEVTIVEIVETTENSHITIGWNENTTHQKVKNELINAE